MNPDPSSPQVSPVVSVVVPVRNESDMIRACLESILAQKDVPGGFEVLVCDGISDDGTDKIVAEIARRDPRVRLIANPRRIVSTALNEGIQRARGEIVIRVDAHTRIADDYVARCVETLRETKADNVGGPWRAEAGESVLSRAIAAAFQHPFAVGGARCRDLDYEGRVDTVYLGCWRNALFNEVGWFDEELMRNQDDEMNLRLTRAHKKIWQSPAIRSWYVARGSFRSLWRQYFEYGFWKIRVMQKHGRAASIRHWVPLAFVCALLVGIPLAFVHVLFARCLAAGVAVYLACVLGASIQAAARNGWVLLVALPVVFPIFHLSYGFGSLCGAWRFLRSRRGGAARTR
ncbi:glycosyltransferase [Candidatus Sumerlaeota bacterium]|nr:glycosyltransferase [Candidatus Sumerlaeota bacterium]